MDGCSKTLEPVHTRSFQDLHNLEKRHDIPQSLKGEREVSMGTYLFNLVRHYLFVKIHITFYGRLTDGATEGNPQTHL